MSQYRFDNKYLVGPIAAALVIIALKFLFPDFNTIIFSVLVVLMLLLMWFFVSRTISVQRTYLIIPHYFMRRKLLFEDIAYLEINKKKAWDNLVIGAARPYIVFMASRYKDANLMYKEMEDKSMVTITK